MMVYICQYPISPRDEMKVNVAAALLALHAGTLAAAAPAPAAPAAPSAGDLRSRLTDKVISQAIRETLAETKENPRRPEGDVLSGDRYQAFSEQFSEARVPDCLHGDALKHQPARIGPIDLGGLFALPFLAAAKIRGKCQ
jgi:hypothetical protein